jgi:hypothetical protein
MTKEMMAIQSEGTYEVVKLPPGTKAIPVMWLFYLKTVAELFKCSRLG